VGDRIGDVVSQLRDDIRENGWRPTRGDYGSDHSSDLIEVIEAHNCVHGCLKSGSAAKRKEFGPGGNCEILARIAFWQSDDEPIREIDPRLSGPHCNAREAPPPKPAPAPRPHRPPEGIDPLF